MEFPDALVTSSETEAGEGTGEDRRPPRARGVCEQGQPQGRGHGGVLPAQEGVLGLEKETRGIPSTRKPRGCSLQMVGVCGLWISIKQVAPGRGSVPGAEGCRVCGRLCPGSCRSWSRAGSQDGVSVPSQCCSGSAPAGMWLSHEVRCRADRTPCTPELRGYFPNHHSKLVCARPVRSGQSREL